MGRPALFVTVDHAAGVALLRGEEAQHLAYLFAPGDLTWAPRFSHAARGWVVPANIVEDLRAYLSTHGDFAVVIDRRAATR